MDSCPSFETIWSKFEDFEFSEMEQNCCDYAAEFSEWADELCSVIDDPDVVAVNQAKVLLMDKYFEWRSIVPKNHRNKTSPVGHLCIFHVFEKAYILLKVAELSLTPPMLFLPPPPPPPPPPPQIAGIYLGEFDG